MQHNIQYERCTISIRTHTERHPLRNRPRLSRSVRPSRSRVHLQNTPVPAVPILAQHLRSRTDVSAPQLLAPRRRSNVRLFPLPKLQQICQMDENSSGQLTAARLSAGQLAALLEGRASVSYRDDLTLYWARSGFLPTCRIQLVQRARHYRDLAYGLPLSALERKQSRGWDYETNAAFDEDNNLIVRVRTTAEARRVRVPPTNSGNYLTVGACACSGSSVHAAALSSMRNLINAFTFRLREDYHARSWDNLVTDWYLHHCEMCMAIVRTRLQYIPPKPVYSDEDSMKCTATEAKMLLETMRYHNLGRPSEHNYPPRNFGFGLTRSPTGDAVEAAVDRVDSLFWGRRVQG